MTSDKVEQKLLRAGLTQEQAEAIIDAIFELTGEDDY